MRRRRGIHTPRSLRQPFRACGERWRSSVPSQALEQLGVGVIVTDECSRVVELNQIAKMMIALEDGLLIRNNRLLARRSFETVKVDRLIATATESYRRCAVAGRMLVQRRDSPYDYVLAVTPLRADPAVSDRRLAIVTVVDPEQQIPSQQDLAEFYGLSVAEARLATALLSGKRLSQIVNAYNVKIRTLRTQLGSILRKVGVDRQADLVRVLSATGIGARSRSPGEAN